MKKRVKLLTTIASLCLAVALMAFGVYAATSATINVNSSVNFAAAGDIFVDVTVTRTYNDGAEKSATASTYTGNWTDGYVAKGAEAVYTETLDLEAQTLTTKDDVVSYTVTIVNHTATSGVKVTLSWGDVILEAEGQTVLSQNQTAAVEATAAAATNATGTTATTSALTLTLLRTDITFDLQEKLVISVIKNA